MFHIFKFRPWEKLKLVREIDKLLSESDLNIFSHYNPQKWHFSGIGRKANVQNNEGETQKIEKYEKGQPSLFSGMGVGADALRIWRIVTNALRYGNALVYVAPLCYVAT